MASGNRRPSRRGNSKAVSARSRKKLFLAAVVVLIAAILAVLMHFFPAVEQFVYHITGVEQVAEVPVTGLDSPWAVHIIDVGQGDAVLLVADGEYALIDAGPPEAAETVVAYLRTVGVQSLRYLFMTHPHSDHYGGMQAVVENFEIGQVIFPDLTLGPIPTVASFEKLLDAMAQNETDVRTAVLGETYALGSGGVQVVHAGLQTEDNVNLLSLGLMFSAGGLRFLDTGDGEKVNERAMLESSYDLDCNVFLAGHHGSISTSNIREFISAASPAIVVVSCGVDNSYGHPHEGALQNYGDVNATVLRTDQNGSVVVQPDGEGKLIFASLREPQAA